MDSHIVEGEEEYNAAAPEKAYALYRMLMKKLYKNSLKLFGLVSFVLILGVGKEAKATSLETVSEIEMLEVCTEELDTFIDPIVDEIEWDNEELFAEYVDRAFYGTEESSHSGSARDRLSVADQYLYDALKAKITEVADGRSSDTEFVISEEEINEWVNCGLKVSWSAEELGVEKIYVDGAVSEEATAAFKEKYKETFSTGRVWRALLLDCPYELYWHDKTIGMSHGYARRMILNENGTDVIGLAVVKIYISLSVAEDYRGEGNEEYVTDAGRLATVEVAVANATSIVEEYKALSDYEKLVAYKDEIIELVSYDREAADTDDYIGIDPWQLIHVFDGDVNRNVVCEGYAKAYKYLCDKSEFDGEKINCYLVSGIMASGSGHMWNVVTMNNGKHYIVDVTNSDTGTIGAKGGLFLAGAKGDVENGYSIDIRNSKFAFTYRENVLDIWGTDEDSILNVSDTNYAICPEDAHVHTEDWTLKSIPTADNAGILTRSCEVCGVVEKSELDYLKFSGASLSLHSSLTVNYKVASSLFTEEGYESPYVVFRFNEKEIIVNDYRVDGDKYVFEFSNVAANQMNDTIISTLYATYDGELVEGQSAEYSVTKYCYNMLPKYENNDAKVKDRTMLVDLLNYGAAAQVYTSYKTEALANASLTEEWAAWATQGTPEFTTVFNKAYVADDNPTVTWKGAGLRMEEAVTIRYKIATEEALDNLAVKVVSESGKSWSIPSSEFVETDGGYYVYFKGLNAAEMSEPVYATVYQGEEAVSDMVCYSIESYVYSKKDTTDEKLRNMLTTMMKYGNAAYSYIH